MDEAAPPVRVDKWLWAARIVKTRSLASEVVAGGRVQVNGARVKPSRDVRPGDLIEITLAQGRRLELFVRGTAERRGPARDAVLLYEETEASRAAGERHAAERRLAQPPTPVAGGRPTKRDRRRLEAMREGARRGPGRRA
jgi:ribosome-associated heat shock protein Hsp15